MLKGVDVSSHNGYPLTDTAKAVYNKGDFVIVKATQGTNYVSPTCDPMVQQAINDVKLWGFYHYAGGQDAEAEAAYFVDNCKNYFGHGVPVIDWEPEQNKNFGSTTWVRRFVDKVHALTGVWPVIYVSRSTIPQVQNCVNDCGLWVAEWGVSSPGSVTPWSVWTMWQWTTTGNAIDQNYFNGTPEQWAAIAKGEQKQASPADQAGITTEHAIERMARDVINGKYGNGQERKEKIYQAVQSKVNELCR